MVLHIVRCNSNLNFRLVGNKNGKVLFVATKGTLATQTSEPNTSGFATGYVEGFHKDDEMVLVSDSLTRTLEHTQARLGQDAKQIVIKEKDEFERWYIRVEGWFYVPYTTRVE